MTFLAATTAAGSRTDAADVTTVFVVLGGMCLPIGIVLLVLAARRRSALRRATSTAWGRVVRTDTARLLPVLFRPFVYVPPTVVFIDERGLQRSYRPPLGATLPVLSVGQAVPVRYDPAKTSVVQVGGMDTILVAMAGVGALCAGNGVLFLLIGLFLT